MDRDPLGKDEDGDDVYLRDLWPTPEDVQEALTNVRSEMFTSEYARVYEGTQDWKDLPSPTGQLYEWDPESTYVREPPFFIELGETPPPLTDIEGARVLAKVGDSVTTDHISPAGAFAPASPAGRYLSDHGVEPRDFNSYGSRRGNHEVMMRGTFASIRLRNELSSKEGGFTKHLPDGEEMSIYDAAMKYSEEGIPTVVLAGKEYGSGSSRDWAAKGPRLQGVRAVIAETYERIHRSNLVGMGVLPLQFLSGESAETHGLTGHETFDVTGISEGLRPHSRLTVVAHGEDRDRSFEVDCRIDSEVELEYYRHGGVLQMVLRRMLAKS